MNAATVAYDVVQLLQIGGVLRSLLDGILIVATSLAIVGPFVLLMLALHHATASGAARQAKRRPLIRRAGRAPS
jgi:hypothetical protein